MKKVLVSTLFIISLFLLFSCEQKSEVKLINKEDLVIYTSHSDKLVDFIVGEFRERTKLSITIVYDDPNMLINMIRNNSEKQADVLWGCRLENITKNIDLFQKYESPERVNIGEEYKDKDGYWTGFSLVPIVFLVNTSLLDTEYFPKKWSDLLLPIHQGTIAFADPSKSEVSYEILCTLLNATNKVDNTIIYDNSPTVRLQKFVNAIGGNILDEPSLVFLKVLSGEYLIGLSYENDNLEYKKFGTSLTTIYPEDGTKILIDGIELLKNAKNTQNAKLFIDFLLSKEVGNVIASGYEMRSTRLDCIQPDNLPALESIKTIDLDLSKITISKSELLAQLKALIKVF